MIRLRKDHFEHSRTNATALMAGSDIEVVKLQSIIFSPDDEKSHSLPREDNVTREGG